MPDRSMPSQQSSRHTILVVEDDLLVRMPIAEFLRDCGYTVLEAENAQEAMTLVDADGSVRLVFSDVRMPGAVDGFGLAEWLRQTHPDVQVLLTSGYNSTRRVPQDIAREARLIEKPYSQAQVARKIEHLLNA
ncbi:MAG: response regulator [Acetobacteraceae bacterium]|nr:response regulator [Pseudomonadota bacterium]